MAELIEPTSFDAVVCSTGLPEVLIASALARAGKSVLVLDPAESYGGSWSSISGTDFVHQFINTHLSHQLKEHQKQQQQNHQQHQQPSSEPNPDANEQLQDRSPLTSIPVCQEPLLSGVSGCSLYVDPNLQEALQNKGLIIDLAPRVLYQDEPLVQLLVSCQAHNYLEFKLIEGNYIHLDGRLRPVPASRADLFADRTLSLADKRSLGRFMAACMEATEGSGRLKDAFDDTPLVDLLVAEGLSEQLQQVVLYGIAMADTPQPPTQQNQQTNQQAAPETASRDGHAPEADSRLTPLPVATSESVPSASSSSSRQPPHGLVTAAEGLSALELYTRSLGRYGGSGAFMAPCYGSGSLIEAFVRLAAVKGAVTALRHGTKQLRLLPDKAVDAEAGGGIGAAAAAADSLEQEAAAAEEAAAAGNGPPAVQTEAAAAAAVAAQAARVQLLLSSGQTITAGTVVSSSSQLPSEQSSGNPPLQQVAQAVALLDRSLVDGDSSLLLVIPPGSLGPAQAAVIRGLQLGPALSVAPPGHYLLYLSAVIPQGDSSSSSSRLKKGTKAPAAAATTGAGSSAAEQLLGPAVAALAAARGLQQFAMQLEEGNGGPGGAQESTAGSPPITPAMAGGQHSLASPADGGEAEGSGCGRCSNKQQPQQQQQQQQQADEHAGTGVSQVQRPQVLALCYYMQQHQMLQPRQQEPRQQQDTTAAVLQCLQAPAAGFAGYTSCAAQAEVLFKQHFPGTPWLTESTVQQQVQQPTGEAAAEATENEAGGLAAQTGMTAATATAGVADDGDDELDAIDELTAALMELSAGIDTTAAEQS